MNDWALVTGASSGIGRELARLLAEDKRNIVLVARNGLALQALSEELTSRHGVHCRVLSCDLAQPGAAKEIFRSCADLQVLTVINNAGFGRYGPFASVDLATHASMVQVNVTALMELTHMFVRPMLREGRGHVLNVGSVAGFQPGPTVNVYYASKAFVYSFSYALADELAGSGVTVTVLCPGTTRTGFFDRAQLHMKRPWPMMDARTVARAGYRGMLQGKRVVIPGFMNRVMALFSPALPSRWTSGIVRRVHESEPVKVR